MTITHTPSRRSDGSRWLMLPMSLTCPAALCFAGYKLVDCRPSSFPAGERASAATPSTNGWQPCRLRVRAAVEGL